MKQVALAFLAHPDDAEFLCVGTLLRLASVSWQIHIATATAGDCGTTICSPYEISAMRTREAQKSAGLVGATYHCMGERDGLVVYDKPAVQKSIDLFRRVAPSLVFTHPPRDYMMDHEMVSQLARAASFVYAAPNASRFPLLPDSTVPYLYYCDPIGAGEQSPPPAATTLIDVSKQFDRKKEALACHASQREWLRAHHGMDEYLETMQRHASWRGAQIGVAAAEAFVQHCGHAYPTDDLLAKLFA